MISLLQESTKQDVSFEASSYPKHVCLPYEAFDALGLKHLLHA